MSQVAICIPTYNQAHYLPEAVRSAFNQSTADAEVWLSDDASTDDTPAVVAALCAEFPRLRAIRQEHNLGMSGNPRWVVRQPKTEFIVKLDSDDRLHPHYVEKLTDLLRAYPRAGYAHCSVNEINDSGYVTRVRRLARKTGFQNADDSLRGLPVGFRVAANICIFRREALEAVNFYRDGMNFADDWDLAVRLADAGWGNAYEEDILADYRTWDTAGNVRARRKMDEINGCRLVFEDALAPAFQKRHWDMGPLHNARRKSALGHALVLSSSLYVAQEREQLIQSLRLLGGCAALERRLIAYRMGLGPVLQWQSRMRTKAKDLVKVVLHRAARGASV